METIEKIQSHNLFFWLRAKELLKIIRAEKPGSYRTDLTTMAKEIIEDFFLKDIERCSKVKDKLVRLRVFALLRKNIQKKEVLIFGRQFTEGLEMTLELAKEEYLEPQAA